MPRLRVSAPAIVPCEPEYLAPGLATKASNPLVPPLGWPRQSTCTESCQLLTIINIMVEIPHWCDCPCTNASIGSHIDTKGKHTEHTCIQPSLFLYFLIPTSQHKK